MGRLPGTAIGPHSDVYGFGKTCYFALLGTPEPDDKQKASLPVGWRKLLSECTAQPANRLPDFEAVVQRLTRLRVPQPGRKRKKSKVTFDSSQKSNGQNAKSSASAPAAGVFHIRCPHCQQPLAVQEAHIGQTVRCKACSGQLTVPARPKTAAAQPSGQQTPSLNAPAPGTATLQISCPHCRQPLALSRQHVGQTLKCPRCTKSFALRAGG